VLKRLRKLTILGIVVVGLSAPVVSASATVQTQDQNQTGSAQKKDADKAAKKNDATAKQNDSAKSKDKDADKSNDGNTSTRGLRPKKPGPPAGTPGEKEPPSTDDKNPK